jgi:hypothetical protein
MEQFRKLNLATSEHPFSFAQTKGIEIRGIGAARFVVRTFFAKNRLYSISSVRPTSGFDEQLSLLGTLRLLSRSERTNALIAENSPAAFDPSPKASVWESDLISEQLTGKVRRVLTEYQESARIARVPWSDARYDADGNLTYQVAYINGFPESVSTMGWLDGSRVYRSNDISYPMGEGPNETIVTMIMEAPPPAGSESEAKADERYDLRYERTYDAEKRLQIEKVINNRGAVTTFKTFTYSPNRRDIVFRRGDGAFYNRTVEIRGADGKIIEERSCDEKEKNCTVTVYRYELDPKGNWIVRRDFEKKTVKGKPVLKPNGVLYRTIEYAGS